MAGPIIDHLGPSPVVGDLRPCLALSIEVLLCSASPAAAEIDDTFDASEVTARLAGLAEVLIPAS